jgi:LmbE family N-acetylglucosaminyl deacetylase/glycosyltransferase involved in cell wall biosynthesis
MESTLVPYEPLTSIEATKVIVFAPHPDDEVFGCGGAIMSHVEHHTTVKVVIVTDGGFGATEDRQAYVLKRREESLRAATVLGYGKPTFWDYADREVAYGESLVARIIATAEDYGADLLYAPSLTEIHPDHRAVAMAAVEAVRRINRPLRLAMYEVGSPLRPNLLLDISKFILRKREAMRCNTSQILIQPYHEQIEALNRYRTYTLPRKVVAAEAFTIVDGDNVKANNMAFFSSEYSRQVELDLPISGERDLPLVTVIVRSIGRQTLSKALDSIAIQTYSNIEVIIVNAKGDGHNCFTENCGKFPLRFIDAGIPLNRAAALNCGLRAAAGQFIAFLDDDDWFLPDHISKLGSVLKKRYPNVLAVHTAVACVEESGQATGTVYNTAHDPVRLMSANYLPINSVLFSRRLLELGCIADETLDLLEDWDFWLQVSCHTTIPFVPGVSAFYLNHKGSGVREQKAIEGKSYRQIYQKWRSLWPEPLLVSAMEKIHNYYEILTQQEDRSRLEALLREREKTSYVPVTGHAKILKVDSPLFPDGFMGEKLAFKMEAIRSVVAVTLYGYRPESIEGKVHLRMTIGSSVIEQWCSGNFSVALTFPSPQWGSMDVMVTADPTFRPPDGTDVRDLSVVVSQIELTHECELSAQAVFAGRDIAVLERDVALAEHKFISAELASARERLIAIESSTSWRITHPLRRLVRGLRRGRER